MNPNYYGNPSAPPAPSPYGGNNRQGYSENPYGAQSNFAPRDDYTTKLQQFIARYEISRPFAEKLNSLRGYEIVFICDDSGSMTAPIGQTVDPYSTQMTRWDELKQTVSIVVDLANIFDTDGVDVYFLNREPMLRMRSSSDLEILFAIAPEGATPIVPVLRQVLHEKRNQIYERKLLILIATDGIPTDDRERPDIRTLEHVLKNERQPVNMIPVTIIACTDDYQSMEYLNNWDKTIPNLAVVDDYRSEKQKLQKTRGNNFQFGFGDYIVHTLMGGIKS